jgi:hypothetical protein
VRRNAVACGDSRNEEDDAHRESAHKTPRREQYVPVVRDHPMTIRSKSPITIALVTACAVMAGHRLSVRSRSATNQTLQATCASVIAKQPAIGARGKSQNLTRMCCVKDS